MLLQAVCEKYGNSFGPGVTAESLATEFLGDGKGTGAGRTSHFFLPVIFSIIFLVVIIMVSVSSRHCLRRFLAPPFA
jgi:hypothetical protein